MEPCGCHGRFNPRESGAEVGRTARLSLARVTKPKLGRGYFLIDWGNVKLVAAQQSATPQRKPKRRARTICGLGFDVGRPPIGKKTMKYAERQQRRKVKLWDAPILAHLAATFLAAKTATRAEFLDWLRRNGFLK